MLILKSFKVLECMICSWSLSTSSALNRQLGEILSVRIRATDPQGDTIEKIIFIELAENNLWSSAVEVSNMDFIMGGSQLAEKDIPWIPSSFVTRSFRSMGLPRVIGLGLSGTGR